MQINSLSSLLQQYTTTAAKAGPLAGKNLSEADTDKNGSISEAELTTLFEEDAPSDLTTDQIVDFASKMFNKADTNGDGILSGEEFAALKEEMAAPPQIPPDIIEKLGLKPLVGTQTGQAVDVSL